MRLPSLSIRAVVLAAIVAGVVLPALVLLVVDNYLSRQAQEPLVQRNRAAVQVLAASVATEPAWTLSVPGLRAAVSRLLEEPSVCSVAIRGLQPAADPATADGVGAEMAGLTGTKCPSGHPIVMRSVPVIFEGQVVASVQLGFDDTEVDRLVADRRHLTWLLVAMQVVVGVAVLMGVVSLRVLRPISRLKLQAARLGSRDTMTTLEWTRRDELGALGHHLNQAHRRLLDLVDELEEKNNQLRKMAMFDHLTGLPNRALFRELFSHEAAAARRAKKPLALLFIDLDRFKTINDTLGHAAGDELLLGVSQRLLSTLRESDVVCRTGGDEFMVLLPKAASWDQVAATAERLIQAIETPLPLPRAAATAQVSASVGIAMFPDDGEDFDTLGRQADLAMYRAKDLGRSRYSFYHADLDRAFRERLAIERELRLAIERNELVLHFQPVVEAPGGRVSGCEALVRWQHPQRGLLMPGAFIATAEETGLIRELGQWTLEAACRQMAAWKAAGCAPGRVAVNISAIQVRDVDLAAAVQAALDRYGIAPGELELELTESTLLSETDNALRVVEALRATGVLLAIDDFGTGYSSLSYLKRLRPDKLKIDRAFVRDLPDDIDDRALIEAILGIARALEIAVVAEGVENAAQRDYLVAQGCLLQQGYLFSRPVPADALAAMRGQTAAEPLAQA